MRISEVEGMPWVAFGVAYGLKSREIDKLVFWLRRHAGDSAANVCLNLVSPCKDCNIRDVGLLYCRP